MSGPHPIYNYPYEFEGAFLGCPPLLDVLQNCTGFSPSLKHPNAWILDGELTNTTNLRDAISHLREVGTNVIIKKYHGMNVVGCSIVIHAASESIIKRWIDFFAEPPAPTPKPAEIAKPTIPRYRTHLRFQNDRGRNSSNEKINSQINQSEGASITNIRPKKF